MHGGDLAIAVNAVPKSRIIHVLLENSCQSYLLFDIEFMTLGFWQTQSLIKTKHFTNIYNNSTLNLNCLVYHNFHYKAKGHLQP